MADIFKFSKCPPSAHQLAIANMFMQVCASTVHIFSKCNYGGASCKKEDKITSLGIFVFKPEGIGKPKDLIDNIKIITVKSSFLCAVQ